jgi:hypothetical protein
VFSDRNLSSDLPETLPVDVDLPSACRDLDLSSGWPVRFSPRPGQWAGIYRSGCIWPPSLPYVATTPHAGFPTRCLG